MKVSDILKCIEMRDRDIEAIEKYSVQIDTLMGASEEAFMAIIKATVDVYAIKHDKDRIDMMQEMIEDMKRCTL